MKITRDDIVDMLRANGDVGSAHQAEANLPEEVDTNHHREVLVSCGVDVDYLLERHRGPTHGVEPPHDLS